MIFKIYDKYYLVCDCCEKKIEFDSFNEAVDYKGDNDWTSELTNNTWLNFCPDCSE